MKPIDEEKGAGGGASLSTAGADGVKQEENPGLQYYHKLLAGDYTDFTNGLRQLTEGSRFPENKGECIIRTDLLENSGLSIGHFRNFVNFSAGFSRYPKIYAI